MKVISFNVISHGSALAFLLLGKSSFSSGFVPSVSSKNGAARDFVPTSADSLSMEKAAESDSFGSRESRSSDSNHVTETSVRKAFASAFAVGVLTLGIASPAFADEYGRETEAPTLGTGESVMICTKRGPLGACLKTETRTEENENDKAQKYFRQPTELVKRKDDEARTAESSEGNALIDRLKKQSEENSEKNELLVYQRTLMNDSSASFGPFDGQVLILNEDGRGFSLLANPQAMRLKKAGLIENKKFIRQPTQEELDAALSPEPSGPNLLDRILGSS